MGTLDGSCLIKIANSKQLTQFLHECVDIIIGRKQSTDSDHYSTTSDIAWTPLEFEAARKLIQTLYIGNVYSDKFEPNLPELSTKDNEQISDCFDIRRTEILQSVIRDSLLKSELPLVENLDWKLKWILGSSKLSTMCEPLLQLDLHCVQNEGSKTVQKTVNCEMNLEQLDNLIGELENVKNSVS